MSVLLGLAAVVGYIAGWFAMTVSATRYIAESSGGYCHGQACDGFRYKWSYKSLCRENCRPGCWRRDDMRVTPADCAQASLWGLVWPLLLLPLAAYIVAVRKPTVAATAARIAELESELGIGDAP